MKLAQGQTATCCSIRGASEGSTLETVLLSNKTQLRKQKCMFVGLTDETKY